MRTTALSFRWFHCTAIALVALIAAPAQGVTVGSSGDWGVSISVLGGSASPASTTSITDIPGGVLLEYNAATGGSGVGTQDRRYDFTTTSTMTGKLTFDVEFDAFTGFFSNFTALHVLLNGAEVQTLVADTSVEPGVNADFSGLMLNLTAGDVWGLRAEAGNFDSGSGVSGDIRVTQVVPEPATATLAMLGLGGLMLRRRRSA